MRFEDVSIQAGSSGLCQTNRQCGIFRLLCEEQLSLFGLAETVQLAFVFDPDLLSAPGQLVELDDFRKLDRFFHIG